MALVIVTHSPEETERLGETLGRCLQFGDVLCLSGELGAGKTCLVRGLARGWGAVDRPTSPTFTLINEYRRERDSHRFHHVDAYRLQDAEDAWSLGLEDVLDAEGVVVAEWAERIREALPAEALWVLIEDLGEDDRRFRLEPAGERAEALVKGLEGTYVAGN
jgi:tRNA threonylcarbamoyladenosine biosynthesis protein TsaE